MRGSAAVASDVRFIIIGTMDDRPPNQPASGRDYGCLGAVSGGCLLPAVLLLVFSFLGDTGGPLFWPILSVFLGLVGLVIGVATPRRPRR